MSARTDLAREVVEKPFDPERLRELGTENMTFYSGHLGLDLQGRDAVADELGKFFRESQPKFQLQAEPVEQGDFVVVFMRATLAGGEQRDLCEVFRFAGDRISGMWTMRA